MFTRNKKVVFTSLMLGFSAQSLAAETFTPDPVSDAIQASTALFQQQCHLNGLETNLPQNCNYYFLNLSNISTEQRIKFSSNVLGLGVESNYILVTKPTDIKNREIYLLDNMEVDYVLETLEQDMNTHSRSRRSLSDTNGNVMEFIIHKRFNIEREDKGNVTLKYKVRYYSKTPFYMNSGDKDKFVEVVLAEGAGVDVGLEQKWSDVFYSWSKNSTKSFVYNEYLDSVSVDIDIDDRENLRNGQIYLNDLHPKMQDQVESTIEREKTTSIVVGLGVAPKLPVKNIAYNFSDKYTITNKKQFSLITDTNNDGYSVKYVNNKYGSAVKAKDGYCNLGTADGWCWDYDSRGDGPWDFNKLRQHNSLAISGMRPDFVAKIAAKPGTTGVTKINVTTKVNTMALFGHNRQVIGRVYASGTRLGSSKTTLDRDWKSWDKDYERLEYVDQFQLNVDWNSPWFLGADAVTIKSTYLSQNNPQCLTAVNNTHVEFRACVDGSKAQSFVYDQEKRYRSVANINQCLETRGHELILSNDCSAGFAKNSQTWYWQEPDLFANDVLYTVNHDRTISAIDASTGTPTVTILENNADIPSNVLYSSRFTDFSAVNP